MKKTRKNLLCNASNFHGGIPCLAIATACVFAVSFRQAPATEQETGTEKVNDAPLGGFRWQPPGAEMRYELSVHSEEKLGAEKAATTKMHCDLLLRREQTTGEKDGGKQNSKSGEEQKAGVEVPGRDANNGTETGGEPMPPKTHTWCIEWFISGVDITRNENGRVYRIVKDSGDWLWLEDNRVLVDTASGIGIDAVFFLENRIHGAVNYTETGKVVDGSSPAPPTLGLLAEIIPPPLPPAESAGGKEYSMEVLTPIIATRELAEPHAVHFDFTCKPSGDSAKPGNPVKLRFTFRQSLMGAKDSNGLTLKSISGSKTIVGAAYGRGSGEIIIDTKKNLVVAASLEGEYRLTVPGKGGDNRRLTITVEQKLKLAGYGN